MLAFIVSSKKPYNPSKARAATKNPPFNLPSSKDLSRDTTTKYFQSSTAWPTSPIFQHSPSVTPLLPSQHHLIQLLRKIHKVQDQRELQHEDQELRSTVLWSKLSACFNTFRSFCQPYLPLSVSSWVVQSQIGVQVMVGECEVGLACDLQTLDVRATPSLWVLQGYWVLLQDHPTPQSFLPKVKSADPRTHWDHPMVKRIPIHPGQHSKSATQTHTHHHPQTHWLKHTSHHSQRHQWWVLQLVQG